MIGERTVVVLRHGRTAWNAAGRFQGHGDPPLDAVGRRQARAAAARIAALRPVTVVTSDLRRAWETAAIVGARCGAPVRADQALREVDLGGWEGLDAATAGRRFPEEFALWRRGEDVRRGGGETLADAGARVAAALDAAAASCPPGGVVVVVSHGLVLQRAMGPGTQHLANGEWATLFFLPATPRLDTAVCTIP